MTRTIYIASIALILALGASAIIISMQKSQREESQKAQEPPKSPASAPSPSPSPSPIPQGIGPVHKNIKTTVFWVGELAGEENDFITNEISFWDKAWQQSFGGVDDPQNRSGYFPKDFTPRENPFYFALPYSDYKNNNEFRDNLINVLWFSQMPEIGTSIIKNRWIMVGNKDRICFGQWEDVGPGERNDFDYVFAQEEPQNEDTGLDLSPAFRDCLQMGDRARVWWQFISEKNVPSGPWKQIITRSGPNW